MICKVSYNATKSRSWCTKKSSYFKMYSYRYHDVMDEEYEHFYMSYHGKEKEPISVMISDWWI